MGVLYQLNTTDPHAENTFSTADVLGNIYESLVAMDNQLRLRPSLAVSWESPDPLSWVFRLRPGVRFHSGKPFTATDVAYSIERLLGDRSLERRGLLLGVTGVEAEDAMTVRLRTARPSSLLLNHLSLVPIVPRGTSTRQLQSSANGTGPYTLAGWSRGSQVVLRANEHYWGGRPAAGEIAFRLGCSQEELIRGLEAGRHQMATSTSRALSEAFEGDERFRLHRRDSLYVRYLGFDLERERVACCPQRPNPFRSRLVRQAISAALDRSRLSAALASQATPASQLVPRAVFGFNPEIPGPTSDPALARSLLKEAGLADGFEAVLHMPDLFREPGLLVKEQLARVGILLDVEPLASAEFNRLLEAGDLSIWLHAYGCPTGDALELLVNAMHTRDEGAQLGTDNFGGFTDPEVDRAIEASAALVEPSKRQLAVQELLVRLSAELVWVPLYFPQDLYVVSRRLEWAPRSDGHIRGAEIDVAP